MRAVAVLLVMLSHAGVPWFAGGFVGVDVFFVISGFLITPMLVRELRSTGRLRMRLLYARRARRLPPASTTVLVVCAFSTWAFLPKNRWVSTGYDIICSAIYGINWRLAEQSVDYLRANSAPSIVRHF
jgi:peptidoglycan/LPS O-acetylase OafA/YrhL